MSSSAVTALGRALRAREVSAVELASEALTRLDGSGRRSGAVVSLTAERALADAARCDEELRLGRDRGPLHGIPFGAKDLLSARGAPTSWGLALYRERVIHRDAAAVAAITRAGGVLVAKLATDELAGGLGAERAAQSLTGPCRNPLDPEAFAGSSSGGPAAAVGAGAVPFALATETIGSIVEPAAFCGVVGVRPSRGRVPSAGAMPLARTLDVIGPIAATPGDCRIVLGALAPTAAAVGPLRRLGIPADAEHGVDADVAAAYRATLDALAARGYDLVAVDLPRLPARSAAFAIMVAECVEAHRALLVSPELATLSARENVAHAAAYLTLEADVYVRALRVARACRLALARLFAEVAALVVPSHPSVAPPIDVSFDEWMSGRATSWLRAGAVLAGCPAVAAPNGTGARGLPTSVCLVGAPGSDERLLALAGEVARPGDARRESPHAARSIGAAPADL